MNLKGLQKFNVNINETSVSGLSSGGFFAVQVQVAHSSIIKGAGIVAGGPFNCGGQSLYAMCMTGSPSVTSSISHTNQWSGTSIDNKSNLSKQRVYMISGSHDNTVAQTVMNSLYKYYVTESHYIPAENVVYKTDLPSGHTFPTDFDGVGDSACAMTGSPYISNCNFDGAGAILSQIYGKLEAKNTGAMTGQFVEINQSEFISSPHTYGLDTKGYLYVPKSCADGEKCRLHISFHGCLQSYSQVGDKYIKNTGFTRWADTNHLLVLFPQTYTDYTLHMTPTNYMLPNPNACWDWIGWYGSNFATKNGVQIKFIKSIIDKIVA